MKSLGQGYPDGKWQSQGLNPDLPDSEPALLPQEAPGGVRQIWVQTLALPLTIWVTLA